MTALLAAAGLLSIGVPAGQAQSPDVATDVKTTTETILRGSGPAEVDKATRHLIDLLHRVATEGKLPQAFRTKVEAARVASQAGGSLDAKAVPALREAYAAVNAGRAFAMPDDVDSMETLMAYGRGRAERSVAALGKARSDEAARELLGFILFVVTPIDAGGGA
jgi:hypothetical protein